jgi:hypothetical protein
MTIAFSSIPAIPGYPVDILASANALITLSYVNLLSANSRPVKIEVGTQVSTSLSSVAQYNVPGSIQGQTYLKVNAFDAFLAPLLHTPAILPILAVFITTSPLRATAGEPLTLTVSANHSINCTKVLIFGS